MQKSISWAVRAAMMAGVLGLVAGCSNVTKEQLAAVEAKASDAAAKAGTAASQAAEALKVASKAAEAAKARNVDGVLAAGDAMYENCEGCHRVYMKK